MSSDTHHRVSRRDAKQRSRERLLDAALALLDQGGEAALTTTAITAGAGLSQSSFYVHFASIDELLRELVDEVWNQRRAIARRVRARGAERASMREFLQVRFRVLVEGLIEHPSILRLVLRSRLETGTLMGEDARAQQARSLDALGEWLAELGAPKDTEADRRRLAMVAHGLQSISDALALGLVDGRYPDIDEVVDVLVFINEEVQRSLTGNPWGDRRDVTSTTTTTTS